MRTKVAVAVAIVTTSLFGRAIPASAHHSFSAEFDANKPIKLNGTVTMIEWVNPHSWIHVNVKNPDGTVTEWSIEGGTPNVLFRRGINKNSLPLGTEIVVLGFAAKDGSHHANGRDLLLPDGKKLFMGSSGTGAPRDGSDSSEK